MRWITFVMLLLFSFCASAHAYTSSKNLGACHPSACSDSWKSWGSNFTLPCDVASGTLPRSITLPFRYEGNYDLCREFAQAQYCTIFTPAPLAVVTDAGKKEFFVVGPFQLDQCVSKLCIPKMLKRSFQTQIKDVADSILNVNNVSRWNKFIDKEIFTLELNKTVQVYCNSYEEPTHHMPALGIITVALLLIFMFLGFLATCIDSYSVLPCRNWLIVQAFSAKHNLQRLTEQMPGDFNALNGIRFLSMCWVIIGHCVMFVWINVFNTTSQQRFLISYEISFIRNAVYAVDTFFFLSGFLASWNILTVLSISNLTPQKYFKFILVRYIRLTPMLIVVMLLTWKVIPYIGSGPYWELVYRALAPMCDKSWIPLLFYMNNFFEWENQCIGWTWYLECDFQLFLLVPLIVQAYVLGRRMQGTNVSGVLRYGPSLSLIGIQLIVTFYLISELEGGPNDRNYMERVYIKPYARMTPYIAGCLLALLHNDRVSAASGTLDTKEWKYLNVPKKVVCISFGSAILMMFTLFSLLFLQYRCNEPKHECLVWFGQFLYGLFNPNGWSKLARNIYTTLSYLVYSIALSVFSYVLFCDDQYDFFGLKQLLSSCIFAPLSRLTYTAYLIHLPLMFIRLGLTKRTPAWEAMQIWIDCWGFISMAYFASFVLYLVIEKPIMNITKYLLLWRPRPKPQDHTDYTQLN